MFLSQNYLNNAHQPPLQQSFILALIIFESSLLRSILDQVFKAYENTTFVLFLSESLNRFYNWAIYFNSLEKPVKIAINIPGLVKIILDRFHLPNSIVIEKSFFFKLKFLYALHYNLSYLFVSN